MEISSRQQRLARFWRKYLRLTRAGVPILRAFELLEQEETDAAFAGVVRAIRARLQAGAALSAALEEAPGEFSLSTVELIRTAEKRGAWDEILAELADGLAEGTFE